MLAIGSASATDMTRVAALAWLIAALASCGIALLQYFGVSAQFKPWINVTAAGDAFANLRQRNQFATLTSIGLATLAWSGWALTRRGVDHPASQPALPATRPAAIGLTALLAAAAILLAIGNASTGSRTGLLQLPLLLALAIAWRKQLPPTVWRVLAIALPAYLIASFALPRLLGLDPLSSGIASRFGDPATPCASRLLMWSNVLHLITLRPWTGWGWGELDHAHFVTPYPAGRFCEILDNAHNLPLHLAVELGIPVALLACGALLWLVLRARPWRETVAMRQLAWAVLALIGLHSLLEYPLWYGPFQMATLLAVWILWRTPTPEPANRGAQTTSSESESDAEAQAEAGPADRRQARHCAARVTATLALAGALLLAVAYAAWDYDRVSEIYRAPELRAPQYRADTLRKIGDSWLFRNQVRFAELTTTDVTARNAAQMHAQALALLHFSPESRVVEKLIDSARLLGRDDEATFFEARYRAAFAADYARWSASREPAPRASDPAPTGALR